MYVLLFNTQTYNKNFKNVVQCSVTKIHKDGARGKGANNLLDITPWVGKRAVCLEKEAASPFDYRLNFTSMSFYLESIFDSSDDNCWVRKLFSPWGSFLNTSPHQGFCKDEKDVLTLNIFLWYVTQQTKSALASNCLVGHGGQAHFCRSVSPNHIDIQIGLFHLKNKGRESRQKK